MVDIICDMNQRCVEYQTDIIIYINKNGDILKSPPRGPDGRPDYRNLETTTPYLCAISAANNSDPIRTAQALFLSQLPERITLLVLSIAHHNKAKIEQQLAQKLRDSSIPKLPANPVNGVYYPLSNPNDNNKCQVRLHEILKIIHDHQSRECLELAENEDAITDRILL